MRAYVAITGIAFALIVVAHIARLFAEGSWLLQEPSFILTSLLSLGLTIWATLLLFKRPR